MRWWVRSKVFKIEIEKVEMEEKVGISRSRRRWRRWRSKRGY